MRAARIVMWTWLGICALIMLAIIGFAASGHAQTAAENISGTTPTVITTKATTGGIIPSVPEAKKIEVLKLQVKQQQLVAAWAELKSQAKDLNDQNAQNNAAISTAIKGVCDSTDGNTYTFNLSTLTCELKPNNPPPAAATPTK